MPLYEYACTVCDHHFDVRHSADEVPPLACPQCGGSVKKVFHAAGIIFKGSGWYVTDSAGKSPAATSTPSTSGEAAKTETPAAKTDTPAATPSA